MIRGLNRYSTYRDSGAEGLGPVPEHWAVRKLKRIARLEYGDSLPGDIRADGEVPVFGSNGRVGCHIVANTAAPCLVIGRKGSFGKLTFSPVSVFAIDTTFYIDSRTTSADIRWLFYALGELNLDQVSKDSAVPGLDREDAYQRMLPVPPLAEQAAIVHFLDHADRRIQRYIRAKKKLIALLNEQKQAIVHQAVTRGLDPNVRLKPSGVEWLGDVPATYQRTKLRRLCTSIRDGTHNPPPASPGKHRLLSVRNIQAGRFVTRSDDRTMTESAFAELQRSYTVQEGDVVLALVGATTGKSAVVEHMDDVTVQRSIGILRPNSSLIGSHYLQYVIASDIVQSQIRQVMDKYAAQPGIYLNDVGNLQVVFPDLDAQRQVCDSIRYRSLELDTSITNSFKEIALIHEYRTRLISDVVTGKLDVREVAAKLPDEAEDLDPLDDMDIPLDGDQDTADVDLDASLEEVAS